MREVTIDRLGSQGDGVVEGDPGPVYVPFGLPGERWRLRDDAPPELAHASPDRMKPVCRHFGTCGGCMSQHMAEQCYVDWKQRAVADAFAHRGIGADIRPMQRVPLHSRRRAFFGVERRGKEVLIGFREEGQHALVDMSECPVLEPTIVAALGALREMARVAMPGDKSGRLVVTRLDAGLDVSFDNGIKILSPEERAKLAALATSANLVRLTVAGDLVVQRGTPTLTVGGIETEPPAGVFLQAVPAAEEILTRFVIEALPKKAKRAVDLFSGIGTFAFPLAAKVSVAAFDSDKRAVHALQSAARKASGLKPIEATARDLFREPLSVRELDTFDFAVFDPPRAGAASQAERLAKSKIPVVVAVSCAPATLARDARVLMDGGYEMGPVTPVDQFLYSPHTEAVATFRRPSRPR